MNPPAPRRAEPARPTRLSPDAIAPRVVLVGRPNVGKSSLHNVLTGGNARVGNFPGVTVEALQAEVELAAGEPARIIDLPGLYSLEAATDAESDEGRARAFLDAAEATPGPLVVAQILDATQLELGLRLTAELCRRRAPLALIVTQRDVLEREGRSFDEVALGRALGLPVLAVSALDPAARPRVLAFLREVLVTAAPPPAFEHDPRALARDVIRDRDPAARSRTRTARIDAVLLHPVVGPAAFLSIMTALFASVFLIAEPASAVLDAATRALADALRPLTGDGLLGSLVEDGILGGAGTVLAFLPQIVILTIAMELVDASGYLARGAFLVDRVLRAAGLGGRSFVPLLTAHACAVPAIQSARAIRDPGQRLRTILVLPLMTCSARLPTYGLLIASFFAGHGALAKGGLFVALYFAGIGSGLIASLVLGRTVRRTGRSLPLVLEMPAYRTPRPAVVARVALRAATRFVRDVGTVILVASCVLWALLAVPGPGGDSVRVPPDVSPRVERMHRSAAAQIGRALEPVTSAAGFDWRINVGLVGSFGARELMVSTLGVIFGIESDDADEADLERSLSARIRDARAPDGTPAYGAATALALMAFFVIACQCMSTLAAIRRETNSLRWPLFVFAYTYGVAFALAVVVYRVASVFAAT